MGTRADFYVGRGPDAQWLGSIAWDGYPGNKVKAVLEAPDEAQFAYELGKLGGDCEDFTSSEMGWPWPWPTSSTTDFAYAFDAGCVWVSMFGGKWYPSSGLPGDDEEYAEQPAAVFSEMSSDRAVLAGGKRSGLIVVGPK